MIRVGIITNRKKKSTLYFLRTSSHMTVAKTDIRLREIKIILTNILK